MMNGQSSSQRQATTRTFSKGATRCRGECMVIRHGLVAIVLVTIATASFGGGGRRVDAFSPTIILENSLPANRWSSTTTATSSLTLLTATLSGDNDSSSSQSTSTPQQQGLFQDNTNSEKSDSDPFQVGAVVRPRYLDKGPAQSKSSSLFSMAATTATVVASPSMVQAATCQDDMDEVVIARDMRRRNVVVAVASMALAISHYIYQFLHPVTPLQLLVDMQSHSAPISIIGKNPKPTVVDFWAPWCENCQRIAPALHELKQEYGDSVNFVMINGDDPTAWPYIQALGVDAIPHLALVTADGYVQTALIGPIPKHILQDDLNALVHKDNVLPHTMLDVFAGAESPEARHVTF